MKDLCTFTKFSDGWRVIFHNGVHLGELITGDDGYLGFWPDMRGGYWSSHVMREIADKMDELDKPWDKIVQEDTRI